MKEQSSHLKGEEKTSGKRQISRRDFLQRLRDAVLGAATITYPGASALADFSTAVDRRQAPAQQEQTLPTDIISPEELRTRFHTTLYNLAEEQFPNDYVELSLRRNVEETQLFQMLENGRLLGMDVLLIDSFKIDPEKFTLEQQELLSRYPTIVNGLHRQIENAKESNRAEIEEHREAMRAEFQAKLQELEEQRASLNADQYSVRLQALNYTYGRYIPDEPLPEDLEELVIKGYSPTLGTATDEQGRTGPHNFVFMAVREREQEQTFVSGEERLTVSAGRMPYRTAILDTTISSESQSYPTPEDYTIAEDANSQGYVVLSGPGWGYVLRHEFQHSRGVFDEESADRAFLQQISEAAQHMQETGSDERYWAVFRTPQGIMITDSRSEPSVL